MRLSGWTFTGNMPDVPKLLIAVVPHTSNWDFVVSVMALWALDIRLSFMGKHTLFRGPFGRWMRSLGGIPVDRRAPHGVVGELVNAFKASDQMILALAPEGTRQASSGVKSGFLHIAHGAQVPILLAYFDFTHKQIGFGPVINTTGNTEADLKNILAFFQPIRGVYLKDWQRAMEAEKEIGKP
jgi:1-acyl-sn-glycerol-3-phosphate acyltransferase